MLPLLILIKYLSLLQLGPIHSQTLTESPSQTSSQTAPQTSPQTILQTKLKLQGPLTGPGKLVPSPGNGNVKLAHVDTSNDSDDIEAVIARVGYILRQC